jgi:PAS domain S-box-containing protein
LSEGSLRNVEAIFRRKDGAIRIGFGTADVIEVNGEPCAISVAADITERKQAEEALQRSEENYRLFVAQSSEGIYREELDQPLPVDLPENELIRGILHRSYVAECNDAMAALYGLARGEELHGKRLTEMLLPEDPRNQEFIRDYIRSGFRVVDRISHEVDIHGNPKVFLNSMIGTVCEGKLVSTWGIQRDITEKLALEEAHRKAEESLRQSEERLRVALSGSPIKVFNQDRDLRYTWVYNLQEGWTEKDYLGKSDEEIFGPEAGATMTAIKRPVLETGRRTRQEFTLNAHGKNYYCDLTVEPLRDAAGAVTGVNCACVDVTDLRAIAEELRLAKERLSEEKLYLEQTIDSELGFGEIIGRSSALKDVMEKVSKVAPSNATVLLQGETGTGKELVARALHRLSKRSTNSFIKLNCAAIPSGLLESELFGHEKGAFTGAVSRKIGRLELADQGTLFLDEVGEIPLSLQPKLLRVLQDQEFERLGSTQTLKVNFRLLAATNRNLLQSVKDGDFRSDLFYRLNVFPIVIPPLRDRREDVRVLVEHFVRHYASRMNKSITSIPSKTMEALVQWEWPGNIRELENFVERSVILTPGSVLQAPLGELRGSGVESDGGTLRDREREKIIRVLSECHGQLGGPNGAAARLGLKRTTLQSRLSQLGIKPEAYRR